VGLKEFNFFLGQILELCLHFIKVFAQFLPEDLKIRLDLKLNVGVEIPLENDLCRVDFFSKIACYGCHLG
jgi:hypothetical protein